jgi:hypothetical protein
MTLRKGIYWTVYLSIKRRQVVRKVTKRSHKVKKLKTHAGMDFGSKNRGLGYL